MQLPESSVLSWVGGLRRSRTSGWGNVTLFSGSDPAHRPHTLRGGPKTDWRVISEEQLRGKLESVSRKDGGKEWKCSLWRSGNSRGGGS